MEKFSNKIDSVIKEIIDETMFNTKQTIVHAIEKELHYCEHNKDYAWEKWQEAKESGDKENSDMYEKNYHIWFNEWNQTNKVLNIVKTTI